LGYMIATRPIAEAVQKVLTTYSTSGLAQAAGLAALAQEAEARRRIDIVIAQRERVVSALREFVPDIPESQGNFCWLPIGDLAAEVGRRFESRGVIVRVFGTASRTAEKHGGVRISIGSPEENDVLLKVAPAVFEGLSRKP
ncbi:MAG: aminotransferase class I/II-fold pyridoxal phosphate-dependent enzyme, partial [Mycobacteriales bacterium]